MAEVTMREFAKQVGCSNVWISNLVRAGKLPVNENKKIPLKEGLEAYNALKAKKEKKKELTILSSEDKRKASILPASSQDESDSIDEAVSINTAMNKAKLAEKTYQARLRELEYKLKAGELLEKTAVQAEAQELAIKVKNKLLSVPARISVMCEGRIARDIEEIMSDAINEALKELQSL